MIFIGESSVMQEVFTTINKLSNTDANILILGENGTGKDVIARLIYRCSPRYGKPFVTIDLGSIPEQLFESELFGFEKGAFTDAKKSKAGRMEVATNGTLFLDEIGNLSLPMQSKLLTAIEKRQISRLGSTQTVPIDVRLICATNADIRQMVKTGISVRTYYIVSTRLKYIYLHSVNVAMTSSCLQITFWTVIPVNIKRKYTD